MNPCYHWIERLIEARNELTTIKAALRELIYAASGDVQDDFFVRHNLNKKDFE